MIRDSIHRRRLIANALLATALLVCAMLLLYPPNLASFCPTCPIREFLGVDCPGCGATRALAALLHGQILEALRLNALFVMLLPVATVGAVVAYRRAIRPGTFRWPSPPPPTIYATLAITLFFTVARNVLR